MPPSDDAGADDARLVARCRAGDAAAWRALVVRYQRLVHAIVLRAGLDGHAAADVFQTVFRRLLDHLPRLAQPERLQAWIVTTAKREALRERERAARHVSLSADDESGDDAPRAPSIADTLADEAPLAEDRLAELQHLHRLRDALERLEPRCRELLQLLFAEDDDEPTGYDAIGRRLNMPVGSIGPTRSRCLAKLRRLFEGASGV